MNISTSLPQPYKLEEKVAEIITKDDVVATYGDQKQFQKWKVNCTKQVSSLFSEVANRNFFSHLLTFLGNERSKIAEVTKSNNFEKFGKLRTLPGEETTYTALAIPRYRAFNERLRNQFADAFPLFQHKVDSFSAETNCSRYTIKKINQTELRKLVSKLQQGPSEEEVLEFNELIELINTIGGLADIIHSFKFPSLNRPSNTDIGPLKIGSLQFLVATIETKVGRKWKTMTRHIAWLNQTEQGPITKEAIEYFKDYGFVTLVHRPKINLRFFLPTIEQLTKLLIMTKDHNPQVFSRDLARLEYYFFHAMPYYRGTVTVFEILRQAICDYKKEKTPNRTDMESLSDPFPPFLNH